MTDRSKLPDLWRALAIARAESAGQRIADLFEDRERFPRFSARCGDLLLDFSKTALTDENAEPASGPCRRRRCRAAP